MKQNLLKTLLLTCLLGVWGANIHAATLEIENGTFENWTDTSTPVGWANNTGSNATLSQSTDYHEGTYSVSIAHASGNNRRMASKDYTLSAGTYTISFYAKSADSDALGMLSMGYVPITNGSAGTYNYVNTQVSIPASWTEQTFSFTLTAETTLEFIVMNHQNGSGAVLVDDYTVTYEESETPSGHGYEPSDPYTCEEAIEVISALESNGTISGVYVKGIVSTINSNSYSSNYGDLTYYISDDGTTSNQLEIYYGYYLNNTKFTDNFAEELMVGDEVIVYGEFTNYSGNTPEGARAATYIYSLTRNGETIEPEPDTDPTGNGEVDVEGTIVDLINPDVTVGTVTTSVDFTTLGLENAYDVDGQMFTFTDGSTVTFAKGDGQTTPKYYTSGTAIRVYADNTLTFSCERAIAMIELHCYSTYEGNQSYEYVNFSEDGKTAVYCNYNTTTSGGTNLYVQSITITYAAEDGDQIDPQLAYSFTSVTCDTSNYGDVELPELTYADDFDGVDEITYSSSNEEVATITEAGVVTILGVEGTASITATFPGNNTYFAETASFTITVEATHTFNFEVNNYGLTPISDSSTYDTNDATLNGNDGVTLALTVASGNGYRLWEGQDYNDLRLYNGVVMTITTPNQMTEISFYCESSYVGNMTSDVGEYITSGTTGTWTGNATTVTFTMSGQMRIRTIDVTQQATSGTFTITDAGYATYYIENAYIMPEGVTGTTVTGVTKDTDEDDGIDYVLTMPWEYAEGSTVPAGTALVLQGTAGTYEYEITTSEEEAPSPNLLMGSIIDNTTTYGPDSTKDYLFYELSTDSNGENVGFYWGANNGEAFQSAANKAWLPLDKSTIASARFIGFGDDTTGIFSVESASEKAVSGIYTIQGVRVSNMNQPGLYIVDGKKILVK